MFKQETVFILGAGASNPYGYPLGNELIGEIIKNIEQDSICLPNLTRLESLNLESHYSFENSYKIITGINLSQLSIPYDVLKVEGFRYSHYVCSKVKIKEIKLFNDFKIALELSAPKSIDAFLYCNPDFRLAGKIMIIYTLLKHENHEVFSIRGNQKIKKEAHDNWYSLLIHDLLSELRTPDDIFNNNINFITFNYDLSLEFCLREKLLKTGILNQDDISIKYITELINNRINHVYGKIYPIETLTEYGKFFSQMDVNLEQNVRRFFKACQSVDEIKTINEERKEIDKGIADKISKAKEIIIIGLFYDQQNFEKIGLPYFYRDYLPFLEKKTLKFLNYEGRMKNVTELFRKVREHQHRTIIESTSLSISSAYQDEFRSFDF